METEQRMGFYTVDKFIEMNFPDYFSISGDSGRIFVPGQWEKNGKFRCIYCQSNCGAEFSVDGETVILQRGDIVAIRPEVPHGFLSYSKTGESYAGYMVDVSTEYIQYLMMHRDFSNMDFQQPFKVIHTRGTLWERIDTLFLMALEEDKIRSAGWKTAIFGSSVVLLVQIARAAALDPNTAARTEKQELVKGIIAYVENNLAEKITLEDVANRFFVSASTVTHLFNKRLNVSFYKYVMQRRLWQAQNLIREGMPMEKIATAVGFNDYSAFYRAFRQEYGMSPRQYLKKTGGK